MRIKAVDRPDIQIDGDVATPRIRYAKKAGVSERTVKRMKLPGLTVGGVQYILEQASQQELATRVRRPHELQRPRRRRVAHETGGAAIAQRVASFSDCK